MILNYDEFNKYSEDIKGEISRINEALTKANHSLNNTLSTEDGNWSESYLSVWREKYTEIKIKLDRMQNLMNAAKKATTKMNDAQKSTNSFYENY